MSPFYAFATFSRYAADAAYALYVYADAIIYFLLHFRRAFRLFRLPLLFSHIIDFRHAALDTRIIRRFPPLRCFTLIIFDAMPLDADATYAIYAAITAYLMLMPLTPLLPCFR